MRGAVSQARWVAGMVGEARVERSEAAVWPVWPWAWSRLGLALLATDGDRARRGRVTTSPLPPESA